LPSLLVLVPLLVCLVPTLDSLQGTGEIRVWDKWKMGFAPIDSRSSPFIYWLNLIMGWTGTPFFSFVLVMMPKQ